MQNLNILLDTWKNINIKYNGVLEEEEEEKKPTKFNGIHQSSDWTLTFFDFSLLHT